MRGPCRAKRLPRRHHERGGMLHPVTALTPARAGEKVENRLVRFRTVGDITCTCPVASPAEILAETASTAACARNFRW